MSGAPASGAVYYEVAVDVAEGNSAEFVEYMTERHIAEVVATGCFLKASFITAGEGHFRTTYEAASRDDLERYLREHANALRRDFLEHFPHEVRVSRDVWIELRRWPA